MLRRFALIGSVMALLLAAVSCGGGGDSTSTTDAPTSTAAATTAVPATTAAPAPTTQTTAGSATTAAETPSADGDSGGAAIELRAKDLQFIGEDGAVIPPGGTVTVTAGVETTVTLSHNDFEPHNFHIRTTGDLIQKPDGALVADYFTPIKDAPSEESLTFTITEPGEYQFFCDTHPLDMTGTLVVAP